VALACRKVNNKGASCTQIQQKINVTKSNLKAMSHIEGFMDKHGTITT
jgi:hypothetical protein